MAGKLSILLDALSLLSCAVDLPNSLAMVTALPLTSRLKSFRLKGDEYLYSTPPNGEVETLALTVPLDDFFDW